MYVGLQPTGAGDIYIGNLSLYTVKPRISYKNLEFKNLLG